MILRVRPAQFTTTSVFGSGAMSPMRYTSSPPGTLTPVGIDMRTNSSCVRLSSTTIFRPASIHDFRSGGSTLSVP